MMKCDAQTLNGNNKHIHPQNVKYFYNLGCWMSYDDIAAAVCDVHCVAFCL